MGLNIVNLRNELYANLRSLLSARHPIALPPPGEAVAETVKTEPHFRRSGDVRRVLRIEIDRDREGDIMRHLYEMDRSIFSHDREGPYQLDGVDLYVVDKLPEPGWRIINPLRS